MTINNANRLLFLGLVVANCAPACRAQETPVSVVEATQPASRETATTLSPTFPEMTPPKPPKVTCVGDQLTISADNSTLGSVLSAVHACIGVEIDIPESASGSRVFEELGPGPARQVLETLLSGTNFNFAIGSSATNPERIDAVLLIERPVETANAHEPAADRPLSALRRAWLQSRQNRAASLPPDVNHPAADETPSTPETEDSATALAADANAGPAQAPATDASSPAAVVAPAIEAPSSPGDSTAPAAPITPTTESASTPSPSSDPNAGTEQKIGEMQQLFQQRRLMNQNQNQSPGQNSAAPQL